MRPGVTLLAIAGVAACAHPSRGASPDTSREVRVLVYNIHAGKDAKGVENLERVAVVVRESGADIVLLQELDVRTRRSGGVDQPAELARLTGFHAAFGKSLDYQGGEYGIAILSRWPVAASATRRLPVTPPQERAGGVYEPRAALLATLAIPGVPLTVINTHIDPSGDDRWRLQEIRTILGMADSLRRAGATLLVGGDFNSTPESAVQVRVRASSLRDAWGECGRGDGFTYPADSSVKRIDYLFLTGALRCTKATVPGTEASDHRPLLVKVRLDGRRNPA